VKLADSVARELETLVVDRQKSPAPQIDEDEWDDEGLLEAPEGRLQMRKHFVRERNRRLVDCKRTQSLKKYGRLACEVCDFDFSEHYGERGDGFIECHHTKAISALKEGQRTKLEDLALVCSNCHRMIHCRRPWLSITQVRKLINAEST
jgi:predicted HNH restriction endonuclease